MYLSQLKENFSLKTENITSQITTPEYPVQNKITGINDSLLLLKYTQSLTFSKLLPPSLNPFIFSIFLHKYIFYLPVLLSLFISWSPRSAPPRWTRPPLCRWPLSESPLSQSSWCERQVLLHEEKGREEIIVTERGWWEKEKEREKRAQSFHMRLNLMTD